MSIKCFCEAQNQQSSVTRGNRAGTNENRHVHTHTAKQKQSICMQLKKKDKDLDTVASNLQFVLNSFFWGNKVCLPYNVI